jgi:hypothetical protein
MEYSSVADPGCSFRIRIFPSLGPGSRGQKGPGSRIRNIAIFTYTYIVKVVWISWKQAGKFIDLSVQGDSTYAITKSGLLCEFNNRRLLDKWVELRTTR